VLQFSRFYMNRILTSTKTLKMTLQVRQHRQMMLVKKSLGIFDGLLDIAVSRISMPLTIQTALTTTSRRCMTSNNGETVWCLNINCKRINLVEHCFRSLMQKSCLKTDCVLLLHRRLTKRKDVQTHATIYYTFVVVYF